MTARCYELGLIPCTKTKNPVGVTALTLYRSSPFSVQLRHAQQRCSRILIMSAKYGLLRLGDRVAFYEAYLPTLTEEQQVALRDELRRKAHEHALTRTPPNQVLCYLPRAYYEFLVGTDLISNWAQKIHRPYKSLPTLTLTKVLSNEIKGFESPGLARR